MREQVEGAVEMMKLYAREKVPSYLLTFHFV